jgi:hypothetical protein
MNRQDYQAIAAALAGHERRLTSSTLDARGSFKDLVNDLMLVMEEDNSRFDRSRFIAAVWDNANDYHDLEELSGRWV